MCEMFCNQCQETANNTGCTKAGVCGKNPLTANYQDCLIYLSEILAHYNKNTVGEELKLNSHQIIDNLFITITNANFDNEAILSAISNTIFLIKSSKSYCGNTIIDDSLLDKANIEELYQNYRSRLKNLDVDIKSLKEIILYGLKGMAAYYKHALNLNYFDNKIEEFILEALDLILINNDQKTLLEFVNKTGEFGVNAMALLDKANTESYGNPEISEVKLTVGDRPAILISGHDLKDMEELLEQSKDSGIDIYTHSEMLPANYYPFFKKYKHLKGNYGNAWWQQHKEFNDFNGPILMTTNCIVPPLESYKNRLFTTGTAGFEGCKHIEKINGRKDFTEIIELAKKCKSPKQIEEDKDKIIFGGFAHNQVIALADKIINLIKVGKIKEFVVMAGCDGRNKERSYYTDFAKELPKDSVILTAGCAKYRYNKLNLGDIDGVPRVLDAGQCNDSYSLVKIALALKDVFQLNDINELPIRYNIAWYEQKAVIVLLALLYLGVKNIHLGPTLPAFISPNVLNILVESYKIGSRI